MTSAPDLSGFDYSAGGPIPASDIAPVIFDNSPGYNIEEGPILNGPGIGGYSAPATDPNSVGGILNGLSSLAGNISKITSSLNAPGAIPRPPSRLGAVSPVGTLAGGFSLPVLALLGVGAWFLLKKKKAA